MNKVILFVFAFVALCYSQQSGPLTVTSLTNGVPSASSLPVQSSSAFAYNVQVFSFYVMENASLVNVTINNLGSNCGSLELYTKTGGLACSSDQYSSSEYPCAYVTYFTTSYSSVNNKVYIPGSSYEMFDFSVGSTWYFSVQRYSSSYYDEVCPYTITVTVPQTCPSGSVSYAQDLSSSYYVNCSSPYTEVATFPAVYNISGGGPTTSPNIFKIDVPTATVGQIMINVSSNISSTTVYGKNFASPTYSDYNCYTGSSYFVNGMYTYSVNCYTPRKGAFYVAIQNDDAFMGSITIQMMQCTDASMLGGYNCSYPSMQLNVSNLPMNVLVAYPPNQEISYSFAYYYMDFANYTGNNFQLQVSLLGTGSSNYVFIRKDGYPEYSSTYGYEFNSRSTPATFTLTDFDFQVDGRWYLGLSCYNSGYNCNFTISANSSSTSSSSSSGAATTASMTTAKGLTTASMTTAKGLTTADMTTAKGLTTASMTTASMTTAKGLTTSVVPAAMTTSKMVTSSQMESSDVISFVPSVLLVAISIVAMMF